MVANYPYKVNEKNLLLNLIPSLCCLFLLLFLFAMRFTKYPFEFVVIMPTLRFEDLEYRTIYYLSKE